MGKDETDAMIRWQIQRILYAGEIVPVSTQPMQPDNTVLRLAWRLDNNGGIGIFHD